MISSKLKKLLISTLKLILIWSFFLPICCAVQREDIERQIIQLSDDGCVILNDEEGKPLFSHNPDKVLIPASLVKFVTVIAGFELLGESYRFKTQFFSNNLDELGIRGYGDPFLISEEIKLIVGILREKDITKINGLVLDRSAFSPDIRIPGTSGSLNPYDALNGALVVNFNTINIEKKRNGHVLSAEKETPLTALAIKKSTLIKKGTKERINLTKSTKESLQYVGELFLKFIEMSGIEITEKTQPGEISENNWRMVYQHYNTRSLDEIFTGLMKYSNNYIANQVFLVIGAEKRGYPANLQKSQGEFKKFLTKKWGTSFDSVIIEEASGISPANRMTGRQMATVLESFRPYAKLLVEKKGFRIKSGTLTGVYNYGGYFESESGIRPFVIMTNQAKNNRNKILNLLIKLNEIRHSPNPKS